MFGMQRYTQAIEERKQILAKEKNLTYSQAKKIRKEIKNRQYVAKTKEAIIKERKELNPTRQRFIKADKVVNRFIASPISSIAKDKRGRVKGTISASKQKSFMPDTMNSPFLK